MGASLIEERGRGSSINDAYKRAVEDAIYEHGNDPYNGTISTTSGVKDVTKQYRSSGKSIGDFAEYLYETDQLQKWGNALGVCLSEPVVNNNKVKTQVNTTPQKGTRKWETRYVVQLFDGTVIGSREFQIDAIKLGRQHTEKNKEKTYVHITKKLIGSSTLVSEISYKNSDKEKEGLYYFIALAAE
jgi:hypothetical protein